MSALVLGLLMSSLRMPDHYPWDLRAYMYSLRPRAPLAVRDRPFVGRRTGRLLRESDGWIPFIDFVWSSSGTEIAVMTYAGWVVVWEQHSSITGDPVGIQFADIGLRGRRRQTPVINVDEEEGVGGSGSSGGSKLTPAGKRRRNAA